VSLCDYKIIPFKYTYLKIQYIIIFPKIFLQPNLHRIAVLIVPDDEVLLLPVASLHWTAVIIVPDGEALLLPEASFQWIAILIVPDDEVLLLPVASLH